MAFPTFDPAKHARGFHGRFAPGGGEAVQRFRAGGLSRMRITRETTVEHVRAGNRGSGAFRGGMSAAAVRARKEHIRARVEVPRGVRPPRTAEERESIQYASPRKIAEAIAKTGSSRMPREEAIRREAHLARGIRQVKTTGVQTTFGGKKRRVRDHTPPSGAKPTAAARRYAGI